MSDRYNREKNVVEVVPEVVHEVELLDYVRQKTLEIAKQCVLLRGINAVAGVEESKLSNYSGKDIIICFRFPEQNQCWTDGVLEVLGQCRKHFSSIFVKAQYVHGPYLKQFKLGADCIGLRIVP